MRNKKGFTLIELLVVIAIIGLLSTLAVVSLNGARAKARDARRVSDVKAIQTAIELYKADNNDAMPAVPAVAWTGWVDASGLSAYLPSGMPTDPSDHVYYVCISGTDYIVGAVLENNPVSAGVVTDAWAALGGAGNCMDSADEDAVPTCDNGVNFCAGSATVGA